MLITASYYTYATGEVDKAIQTYQRMIEIYPREGSNYLNLAVNYAAQGEYEKAAEAAHQGMRAGPDQRRYRECLSDFAIALRHLDEAREICRDAEAHKWDDFEVHGHLYVVGFLEGNSAAMAEQQQWLASTPEGESYGLALASALHGAESDAARVRALAAYKEFLNLWKYADADIPILKAAKSEYAKLQ
jgi:tetratricopeptide (TPR) repeat protein